jgi:nitrate reductase gamma subunit|tara:strand:- start:197 stop:349 length:153 start_codon:yes stop_codon:yes gene_type:complete
MAVLLVRRAMSQKETAESNAADMTPLLLTLSGLIGLFVLFVGVTEFITRM